MPRILTNMALWQSPAWRTTVTSIYPVEHVDADPNFLHPAREALLLWKQASSYDVVLTMGSKASLYYGLLCILTARRSKHIMTELFLDSPQSSLSWKMKARIGGNPK